MSKSSTEQVDQSLAIACSMQSFAQQIGKSLTMKQKKQQDDRLLKQLSRIERKQQEAIRKMIEQELAFSSA